MIRALAHNLQHNFNSLHVYCRLKDFGFGTGSARRISKIYERLAHPLIYGFMGFMANHIHI